MNDRERFVATVLGEPTDRPPHWVFWGGWGTTLTRWERETGEVKALPVLRKEFGADRGLEAVPINCGPCPRLDNEVVEDNAEFLVYYDGWRVKRKVLKGKESMPEFLGFPVRDRADWEAFRDRYLNVEHPERLAGDCVEQVRLWREEGVVVQLGYFPDCGLFGTLRWLLGDEECLMAFCTMPDLVHEIMDHMTNLYLSVFEKVVAQVEVDMILMWEDMCGRQGPLIGPSQFREFMTPRYRRIRNFADSHNIPVFAVDTDGDPDLIAEPMQEGGVNLLYPMEVAAGVDVNVWRKKYPDLAFLGGIDKRALTEGPDAIDAELDRVRPVLEAGRYIPELDHLVPDDVPWQNYAYYARRLRELVGKS